MERKTASGMMLTLLLLGMLSLTFNIQPVRASGTVYIRPNGMVEGTDMIHRDGDLYTFMDNINITQTDGIHVQRDNIVVDGAGYILQGTGNGIGIYLCERRNVTIKNVEIKSFGYGLRFYLASNSIISENTITNNTLGLQLTYFSNSIISGNSITNNKHYAIELLASNNNTISGNDVTNGYGVRLYSSSNNIVSGNTIAESKVDGLQLYHCLNNSISGNIIANSGNYGTILWISSNHTVSGNVIKNSNVMGIILSGSPNNTIHHNDFVNNKIQARLYFFWVPSSGVVWDDGYPSGGNYWSDHVTVDDYSGVNQDELGSDGIVDEPYIIDAHNRDNYPLAQPWSTFVSATVDFDPDAMSLKSQGRWLTVYIELSEVYGVEDIDVSSIRLNANIPTEHQPAPICDHDNDGIHDLMVKFDRAEVVSYILDHTNVRNLAQARFTTVTLSLNGELIDRTPFLGSGTIKIVCSLPREL